jgi:hypothetical protein
VVEGVATGLGQDVAGGPRARRARRRLRPKTSTDQDIVDQLDQYRDLFEALLQQRAAP